jgi:hypothetical protein
MARAFASDAGTARPRRTSGSRSQVRRDRSPLAPVLGARARVHWDRIGRLAMLFVLGALLYLYLSAGIHMLSTWSQSRRDGALVGSMQREHTSLVRQHEALRRQGTVEVEARRLGMINKNEQPYIVSGLPGN